MLVLTIIGTRPEAVKLAPVLNQLKQGGGEIDVHVCVTGQPRDMLDQMLDLFEIRPDADLDIMEPGQGLSQTASAVFARLDPVLEEIEPDWVLVQGDTTTVMASAIAAHHRKIKVAHVEAGLRSFDRANPFPEEMNRVVADHVSDIHFAPTTGAKMNLLREGIGPDSIFITGNTAVDALIGISESASLDKYPIPSYPESKNLILVTAHRRENHGKSLQQICDALSQIASRGDVHVIYPVHRNPEVWNPVHEKLDGNANITLIPPVDYPTMVNLMVESKIILTDSGGIQEEAPTLGKPLLVLRSVTERPEAVEAGAARIVGTESENIVKAVNDLLDNPDDYQIMAQARNPFGDGHAAQRITRILSAGGVRPPDMIEWS